MKTILKTACAFAALLGFSSCSFVGLSTKSQVKKQVRDAIQQGIRQGRADEVRKAYHQEQLQRELPAPESKKAWYSVPVPAHQNSDGVMIEAHTVPIQVIQP